MITRRIIWQALASAVVAAIWAAPALAQQVPPGKPAAFVNGEPIPVADVKAILDKVPQSPVALTEEQKRVMRKEAMDMLIDDQVMKQFLKKNVAPAPAAEVTKKLAELEDALKKQKKTLAEFLKETQQTQEQLRQDIVARLQWKSYLNARLPDAAVKTYYDQNKVFFDKVLVRASHVLVKVKANASPAERQAALAKIQAIRQEIMTGKVDFAEAAKKYSDCPSKTKGGDIGPFPYKFAVVEPFAKTAFSMKIGDVSDVVTTDFGFHIIKVTERTKEEPSKFLEIKEAVREVYAQDLDLYQNIITEQRKVARIEVYLK